MPTAHGSWISSATNREYLSAYTQNDSSNVFGQWCYPGAGSCVWLLAIRTGCEKGSEYPVLVNSDSGSASLKVFCDGPLANTGLYRYVFTEFDPITTHALSSKRVGFAFPLLGDQFIVVRFDLEGAATALRIMRSSAATRIQPGRKSTLDQKL